MQIRPRTAAALFASGLLQACAGQPPAQPDAPGFLAGIFHGLTALFALVGGLVMHVRIYAFPNAGWSYDAGFLLGFAASIVLIVLLLIARVGGFITRGH